MFRLNQRRLLVSASSRFPDFGSGHNRIKSNEIYITENSVEYKPLVVISVDHEKIFYTLDQYQMLKALAGGRVGHRYSSLIKIKYENASANIRLHEETKIHAETHQLG